MDPSHRRRAMGKRVGKYELGRTLGEGTFGKVKFAVNTETGEMVAIKVLDKETIHQQNMGQQIKNEIAVMKMIRHRYVVQLREVLASKSKIFIVLELITGGELFDKLVTEGRFSEAQARFYFRQLIEGVEYCHSQGICHRDLKPENLLLDFKGNLKISDFGLSALYTGSGPDASRSALLQTACGTPNYVAPEVLADKGYDGPTADIWSCGVVLYVLLAAALPFDEPTLALLFDRIQRAHFSYPSWFSPSVRSLLDSILVIDPAQRATIEQIKQHPWFIAEGTSEGEGQEEEQEGEERCRYHHKHREHHCSFSLRPPPPPPPPPEQEGGGDDIDDPPPFSFPYLRAGEDSWLYSRPGGTSAEGRGPALGSRRLLQFGVTRRAQVRMIVEGVIAALMEMDCEVRAKDGGAAIGGVHKVKATRLTPKGLLGVVFEIRDPFFDPSCPPADATDEKEQEEEEWGKGEGKEEQGEERRVLVDVRRGKGDILAFRQFYHDFTRYHFPPLMPPLLHASATTSVVGGGGEPALALPPPLLPPPLALSSSFSGPPGAK